MMRCGVILALLVPMAAALATDDLSPAIEVKLNSVRGAEDIEQAPRDAADFILECLQKQPEISLKPPGGRRLLYPAHILVPYLVDKPAKAGDYELAFRATMFLLNNMDHLWDGGEWTRYQYARRIILKQHLIKSYAEHRDLLQLYWGVREKPEAVGESVERVCLYEFIMLQRSEYNPTPAQLDAMHRFISECTDDVLKTFVEDDLARICYELGRNAEDAGQKEQYFRKMIAAPPLYDYKAEICYHDVADFFAQRGDKLAVERALKKGILSWGSPSAYGRLFDFYKTDGREEEYYRFLRVGYMKWRRFPGAVHWRNYYWQYDPKRY